MLFKSYLQMITDAGVVGAGGAGFPTHLKINTTSEVVIANGAECEPLLRVDRQIMEVYPEKVLEGLRVVMKVSNAKRGVICLKEKYHKAVDRLNEALVNFKNIEIFLVGNYYPAGDEQQLIYEVTGKVIPVGGLPIDAGIIVNNVSTLVNIADAVNSTSVTHKLVTVTGEVMNPVTLNVPIGMSVRKLVQIAGGPESSNGYTMILGGPAMGKIEENWDAPVTKTLGGVIILPSEHPLIAKKNSSSEKDYKLAKSVCCQCNYCTQLCPRSALGLGVKPHKVMRAIGYGEAAAIGDINTVFPCCDCGLCTYYACSMGLSPSKMVVMMKSSLIKNGLKPKKVIPEEVSPSREYTKVPTYRFLERLGLNKYDVEAPVVIDEVAADQVRILLKQHIGVAAVPVVKEGDSVEKGGLIGMIEEGKVGANVHSSITGIIAKVTAEFIEIKAIG